MVKVIGIIPIIFLNKKLLVKEKQAQRKEKYSFITPFKQTKPLKEYLAEYKKETKK